MKILTNKFFILGNLLLILIAIPVTLFFVKKQQEVRSKAAASSKLYFNPANTNTSTQCQNFTVDLMVDPGSNIVSIVDFYITYDPTKVDITQITPSTNFSTTVRASSIASGTASMSVAVGSDVTRAVSTVSKVATITFSPKVEGAASITIDSAKSRVFSLSPSDQPTENVLSTVEPGNITIGTTACLNNSNLTPTVTPAGGASPTPTPTGTATNNSATPTPTTSANQSPICTSLTVSPSATGSAPFSVLFTANGNDPDASGLITKAAFTFGDGQTQNITTGLNQKSVSTQASHTYSNAGTYPATVVFTDNQNAVSLSCTQNVTAQSASSSGSTTPTLAPTSTPTPTAALAQNPTTAPTIPATGSLTQTAGIFGVVLLTLIGGLFLILL